MKRSWLLLTMITLLSSCGLHAFDASSIPSPAKHIFIRSNTTDGKLMRILSLDMRRLGVTITDKSKANIGIQILGEHTSREYAVSGSDNLHDKYWLTHKVLYVVIDRNGKRIFAPRTVIETREIIINFNQVLAAAHESDAIIQSMRRAIARQIWQHLIAKNTLRAIAKHKRRKRRRHTKRLSVHKHK